MPCVVTTVELLQLGEDAGAHVGAQGLLDRYLMALKAVLLQNLALGRPEGRPTRPARSPGWVAATATATSTTMATGKGKGIVKGIGNIKGKGRSSQMQEQEQEQEQGKNKNKSKCKSKSKNKGKGLSTSKGKEGHEQDRDEEQGRDQEQQGQGKVKDNLKQKRRKVDQPRRQRRGKHRVRHGHWQRSPARTAWWATGAAAAAGARGSPTRTTSKANVWSTCHHQRPTCSTSSPRPRQVAPQGPAYGRGDRERRLRRHGRRARTARLLKSSNNDGAVSHTVHRRRRRVDDVLWGGWAWTPTAPWMRTSSDYAAL